MTWRTLALVALFALVVGCKKDKADEPEVGLPAAEIAQGRALCDGYVARVCACAATQPQLASECDDARSRPSGLKMVLSVMGGSEGKISKRETAELAIAARKIVKECVAADAALDPATCPRPKSTE